MRAISLSTYTLNGRKVWQVFYGAVPVTRELDDRERAVSAARLIVESLKRQGKSGSGPALYLWDGDAAVQTEVSEF